MASNRLSFSIAVNLLTENFKKGANSVKTGLRSIQMQMLTFAAALGAGGLGLSGLISRMVGVARETSRVTTALKNVSGSTAQFADNQRFLVDLAKKYGIEINGLTGSYAKFTASANNAGVSIENQKKIFESLSRATTAFGLSSDESNGVFLALSQMMGKGKISSEELRKQMGEKLPIAMAAMAKAAGVSMAGLEKLLKQGKLASADILPKFAEALNEMIPNVDTDNLETSINKLSNAFGDLVNGMGVESKYKSLVDWITKAAETASANIKNIITGLVAVISGLLANTVVKWWASLGTLATSLEVSMAKSNAALLAATQQRVAAELALEKAKAAELVAIDAERYAASQQLSQAQKDLKAATVAQEKAQEMSKSVAQKIADSERITQSKTSAAALLKATQQRVAAEIVLEEAKVELIAARTAAANAVSYEQTQAAKVRLLKAEEQFSSAVSKQIKAVTDEAKAADAAKVASAKAASVKTASAWQIAYTRIKVGVAKLLVSLRAMWSAFAPMLVVTAIVAVIGKLKQMYDEAKRIKSIFSEYKERVSVPVSSVEITKIKALHEEYNKANTSLDDKKRILGEINKILGSSLSVNKETSKEIAKQVALLESAARAELAAKELADSENEIRKISKKKYNGHRVMDMAPEWAAARGDWPKEEAFKQKYGITNGVKELSWAFGDFKNDLDSFVENAKIRKDAKERLTNEVAKTTKTPIIPSSDDKEKKTPLQKAEEKYAQELGELNALLEIGKLTKNEYNKALGELNIKMFAEAKGSGDKKILESKYYKSLETAAAKAVKDQDRNNALIEFEKVQKDYNDKVRENQLQFEKGLITHKELNQNIADLSIDAAKSAAALKGIGTEADLFIAVMQTNAKLMATPIKMKPRDMTFDYKKSKADIAGEELDKAKELSDKLKEQWRSIGKELSDELANAMANVPTLEKALKLAQVREDIKTMGKELDEAVYSGVKEIATGADRLVSAFQTLNDVMSDADATEWEKIMAIWNAMTNVVDTFLSVAKMIESITELTSRLTSAKQSETDVTNRNIAAKQTEVAVDTVATATKVSNAATGEVADMSAAGTKAVTATTEVAANTAVAASESGKSASKLPFPLNIIAIGGAIAATIAAFAAIPKFANGGIITGGPSSGDKILARVNAGEMILNHGQQSRLFQAINSGNLGGANKMTVTGESRVRGADIYLSLSNYMKRTGKRL